MRERKNGRWGRRDGSALTVAANGYDVVTAVVEVVALGVTVAA